MCLPGRLISTPPWRVSPSAPSPARCGDAQRHTPFARGLSSEGIGQWRRYFGATGRRLPCCRPWVLQFRLLRPPALPVKIPQKLFLGTDLPAKRVPIPVTSRVFVAKSRRDASVVANIEAMVAQGRTPARLFKMGRL